MTALPGYFIAPDGYGDTWVWREHEGHEYPVLSQHMLRDAPELWATLTDQLETRP